MIHSFNLRKLGLLALLVVASIQSSYSQITFGLKSGINRSKVKNDMELSDYINRTGFYGGAIVQTDFTNRSFLRAEVLYSVKGSKYLATPGISMGGKSSFHYVNLPIFQGYRPIKNLSVVIGPEFGYLINAKSWHNGQEIDITKSYNRLDLAADLGLIYRIVPLFAIEARYSYGFKLMGNYYEYNDQIIGQRDRKYNGANRVLQFGLSYHFAKQK